MRLLAAVAAAVTAATASAPAWPCAVCATGDATLVPTEQERPFAGRKLTSVDVRVGSVAAGDVRADDRRAELSAAYGVGEGALASVRIPALSRELRTLRGPGADSVISRTTLGDAEADLHVVRRFGSDARQRFGVLVVLKVPTAPLEEDATGRALSSVLQPGCGSLVPAGGFDYAIARGAWSGYAAFSLWLPFAVRAGPHAGDSLRASARIAWQPVRRVALRAGPSARLDTSGALAGGASDPDSGGLLLYAAAGIAATPADDLVVEIGALYPALQLLRGAHREGPILAATVTYDF